MDADILYLVDLPAIFCLFGLYSLVICLFILKIWFVYIRHFLLEVFSVIRPVHFLNL